VYDVVSLPRWHKGMACMVKDMLPAAEGASGQCGESCQGIQQCECTVMLLQRCMQGVVTQSFGSVAWFVLTAAVAAFAAVNGQHHLYHLCHCC
jgi:hypothetical protein